MSRATVDLQSVRFFLGYGLIFILQNAAHDPARRGGDVRRSQPVARRDHARARAVRDLRRRRATGAARGRRSQEVQQRIAELTAEAEENISGIRVVKAFAREERQLERFRDQRRARVRPEHVLDAAARLLQPDDRLPAEPRPRRGAAGRRPPGRSNGSITLGEFVAFYAYLLMLIVPDADARHRARHGAARGRVGRPRVRDPRPRAAADRAARTRRRCRRAAGASSCAT